MQGNQLLTTFFMNHKSINSNKQFMIGNGILAFGVFFIVCLFLYLGFRHQPKSGDKTQTFEGLYAVEITPSTSTTASYSTPPSGRLLSSSR